MATEGQKRWRRFNLREGSEELEILVAEDYQVVQFSPYHFRVNDKLDIWPSSRKWYDRRTKGRGQYKDLLMFVRSAIKQND